MKIFKITYYDEIEAETEDEAVETLKRQLASDVKHGDVSCFEFEEIKDKLDSEEVSDE